MCVELIFYFTVEIIIINYYYYGCGILAYLIWVDETLYYLCWTEALESSVVTSKLRLFQKSRFDGFSFFPSIARGIELEFMAFLYTLVFWIMICRLLSLITLDHFYLPRTFRTPSWSCPKRMEMLENARNSCTSLDAGELTTRRFE